MSDERSIEAVMNLLGLSEDDFLRYRSAHVDDQEGQLTVTARDGYAPFIAPAVNNKHFIDSESDDGDGTYIYYYFNIPAAQGGG